MECSEYERFKEIEIKRAITVDGPVAVVLLFVSPMFLLRKRTAS